MLKITIMAEGVGSQGFVIGDNSLGRGAGSRLINTLQPALDAMVQTVAAHRAPSVVNMKRDDDTYNESTQLAPEVEYEFLSEDEKARFLLDLSKNVPPVATVQLQVGQTVWYLIDAKLRPISTVEEWQVAIRLRWAITGGRLVNSLPTS